VYDEGAGRRPYLATHQPHRSVIAGAFMNICGFMLVRKPADNYYPMGKGIWPRQAPHIGNIYYGGAWRMPWCDIEFDLYDGNLPGDLRDLYSTNVTDLQGSSFALCSVFDVAKTFLEYCNRDQQQCELIAVYSTRLASMKGTIPIANIPLEHQGWEPFQMGGGSLLTDVIFVVPNQFPTWQHKLNYHGLLTSAAECLQYISEYQHLIKAGLLEEIFPSELCPIEPVEILSVRTPY
jgi:hypothetical protein